MSDDQKVRELRWKNKQISKALGQAGDSIYRLRAVNAELLSLIGKHERGELRRAERVIEELRAEVARQAEEIKSLSED